MNNFKYERHTLVHILTTKGGKKSEYELRNLCFSVLKNVQNNIFHIKESNLLRQV